MLHILAAKFAGYGFASRGKRGADETAIEFPVA